MKNILEIITKEELDILIDKLDDGDTHTKVYDKLLKKLIELKRTLS